MIKFIYNSIKEKEIFSSRYFERNPEVLNKMIQAELEQVIIEPNDKFILDKINFIEQQWKKVEGNFLHNLGEFYEQKLIMPEVKCYLTRLNIFPYNFKENQEKWFSAPLLEIPMRAIAVSMHELLHYFQPQKLPRSVKEAIPVILDNKEKFGVVTFSKGHQDDPKEQEWRKIIWNLYKNNGKFSDLERLVEKEKRIYRTGTPKVELTEIVALKNRAIRGRPELHLFGRN